MNLTVTRSYREAMRSFAPMRTLDVWYARLDVDDIRNQWAATVDNGCWNVPLRARRPQGGRRGKRRHRAWIVLMVGNDDSDPLMLQFKEAEASVLEPFLGKRAFTNHGQRVVEGQRLMRSASDIMLGWLRTAGLDGVERDFYMRELWDG